MLLSIALALGSAPQPLAVRVQPSLCAAPRQEPAAPPPTIEAEVAGNVLGQPLGSGTVADLALPDELVARVADRIIRSSFEERFGIAVPDPVEHAESDAADTSGSGAPAWAFGAGYALIAVLLATWMALRARRTA